MSDLSERDIVTADLHINWPVLFAIARHRAERAAEICERIGHPRDLAELVLEEKTELQKFATLTIATRAACRAASRRSPRTRLIRSLEYRLAILCDGLAQPRDEDAIAHHETLLAEARKAAPADAGVILADKLMECV